TIGGGAVVFDPCHDILRISAVVLWASWQRSHSRITWSNTLSLTRQKVVGCVCSNHNPVTAIAALGAQQELSNEVCARFDCNRIPALRIVQRSLKIVARMNRGHVSWSRRVRQRTCHSRTRQFRRTIKNPRG